MTLHQQPDHSKNTDNRALSRRRRRDVVENDEYAGFARRILAAYARRVAAGDIEALAALVQLGAQVEDTTRTAVVYRRHRPTVEGRPTPR